MFQGTRLSFPTHLPNQARLKGDSIALPNSSKIDSSQAVNESCYQDHDSLG